MARAVIIDDEAKARGTISKLLQLNAPQIDVVGEAGNIPEAENLIENVRPQIVFLDIRIGNGLGFQLIESIRKISAKIIFITAHAEYAVRAFDLSALDYVLKPVDPVRLTQAVEKALENESDIATLTKFNSLRNNLEKNPKIVLSTHDGLYSYAIDEVMRCEADGNYTRFVFTNGQSLLVSSTLLDFERKLCTYGFFRVHKKHLINTQYFRNTEKQPSESVVLTDGSKIPLAWRRKDDLISYIKSLSI